MFSKSDSVQKNNPLNANNAIRFIIDFRNADGSQDTLQDYINREPDYDLAFCKTWQTVFGELENKKLIHDFLFEKTDDRTPSKKIEFLVNYLELIQENSLQHR